MEATTCVGARVKDIMWLLLLAAMLPAAYTEPRPAKCRHYKIAESSDVSCADFPQFNTSVNRTKLDFHDCPPRIPRSVGQILPQPSLQTLNLYNIKEPLRSDDVEDLHNLTTLNLFKTDGEIVMNNMSVFKALPTLRNFAITHGNLRPHPHMFNNWPSIETLILIDNNITSLLSDVFIGLASLKELIIQENNVGNISAGSFRGLGAVEVIILNDNNITNIEVGAFSAMLNLRNLSLVGNSLQSLSNGLLNGLERLENIQIYENKDEVMTLGSRALSGLPALSRVELFECGIRSLPENLFLGSNNILDIDIQDNVIPILPSKIFESQETLRSIDFRNNRIQKIEEGVFNNKKTLQFLDLSSNMIEELSESIFDGLSGLLVLHLRHNHIKHLHFGSTILPKLDRSHIISTIVNRDEGLDWSSEKFLKTQIYSPFNSLKRLNTLDLSANNISYFYKEWASDMPNIAMIDLSRNRLTSVRDFQADFSRLAVFIDLRYNNIADVYLDPGIPHKNDTPPTATESYLMLDHNPIHCDCHAYSLYLRLNGVRSREDPIYVINHSGCVSPPHLKGQLLKAVSQNRLVCDLKIKKCARGTSTYFPATNEVVMNCSKMPPKLKKPKYLKMIHDFYEVPTFTLRLDYQPESIEGFAIHKLNLSNAGINSLAFRPSESLKVLDVSNNNLSTIPDEFFKAKITLYISNNPLECDCSFTEKLLKYNLVGDLERATCGNGDHITEINVRQICNRGTALGAIIGNCAVGGLFLLMIARAIYKNKKDILAYILSNLCGRDPGYIETIERRLDAAKQFDLFVSFAHQDENFVTGSLLPKLENEFGQKVCVHSRDWVAGDLIVDQIIRSVDSSRRTIIVLTESFLLSDWSFFEFHTAHNLSIQEGRPRVIIVLLDEDISKDERLGPELRSYITINTYLLWGDPNFWEKLKKALPRRK